MRKSELDKAIAALVLKREALDLAIAALRAQADGTAAVTHLGPPIRRRPTSRPAATTEKESA